MTTWGKRIQVRGSATYHTCWEGSPQEFEQLKGFTCDECEAEFYPGDDSLGTTHLFEFERRPAPAKRVSQVSKDKTEDWAEIAAKLRDMSEPVDWAVIDKAADLCERVARGELVDPGTCAQCKRNFNLACGSCGNR